MKKLNNVSKILAAVLIFIGMQQVILANEAQVEIYTPYTQVAVTPGSTVNYSIDIINHSSTTINSALTISKVPRTWDYTLSAAGMNVDKIAVLGQKKQSLKLKIEVPYQVRKGNYTFYVRLGNLASQALTVRVSSAGANKTELNCNQKNMEGTAKSSFSFNATLKNKTASKQHYALMANAPKGWQVIIKPNSKQATSTEVEANATKSIYYSIKAPYNVKAGHYKIPVRAVSGSSKAEMELEVVIIGTNGLSLHTPTGLVSAKTTAGESEKIELNLKNTGTLKLENIALKASTPHQWKAKFEPQKIEQLEPGKQATVYLTVTADKKAIPGDYLSKITASTTDVKQELSLRVMVKTPSLMSWLGVIIILLSLGALVMLMRKFGRR